MQLPGGWEWIFLLIIILILFGPGRISKIAGEIGRGIREFRSGLQEDDQEESPQAETTAGEDGSA